MAAYYFDTNGATAGFGTLTGNWDTTTALWSTSSAGTAATAAVTFTNADAANFGFTGTTGTAGTATIQNGVTVTLNQIVTANLAGLQTIAATGTGALALAGASPTISVGSAGGLTISGPITGTAGFTKAGAGNLTLNGSFAGLTGTIAVDETTAGLLVFLNPAFSTFTAGTTISVTGPADYGANRMVVFNPSSANQVLPAGFVVSGTGAVSLDPTVNCTGAGYSFPSGALASLTGTNAPSTTSFPAPSAGLSLSTGNTAAATSIIATVKDFPSLFSFYFYAASITANTRTLFYDSTAATHNYGTRIDIVSAATSAQTMTVNLYANQATGPLVLSGGVRRYEQTGQSRTATLVLRGSTLGVDNQISGNIEQISGAPYGSGVLAITKADAGRWILSGTNTYTGANTVSAGTLVANSNAALGQASGTASSITTGATLEIGSGITVNKASTQWTLNGNTAANGAVYAPSGNAGLTAANFVLGTATTDIKADAGATLTLTSAGAITGNFILRHIGAGTAVLAQTAASTFTALNIQSGTVSVSAALAAGGVSSGIGNGSTAAANWLIGSTATAGTFRYTGAASSTNRNFTIGTAGSTFDASGSGVLTLTGTTPAFSAANTACTLTLAGMAGTSATPNTSAMVLPDNTQPVGLTKTGTGAWKFTASQTYTGATTITGGSMSFGETNIATNVVFNGPGILREVVLNGVSKTITCSAGASDVAELIATSSHNTITGSTNITTGTLKLTTEATAATKPVKVLGDTNVSVTGKLQTSTGTLQRGQMRYGGDLTFQAGSTFIIGG